MNIREKILIVEDEKSIAHFISTILNSNDYETLLARSGSEAKTMISSHWWFPPAHTSTTRCRRSISARTTP